VKLTAGLTIAIEPMVMIGSHKTRQLSDQWTVVTVDNSRAAHFEHTIAITAQGPRVLTRLAA
jgi:methionyl aminopeptidase